VRSGYHHLALGLLALGLAMTLWVPAGRAQPASDFAEWTSVVLAGDWRDGDGKPIEAFDNARRDLSKSLLEVGFPAQHHVAITLNPAKPDALTPAQALQAIGAVSTDANKGCLIYLTSHGTPSNIVFGDTRGIEPVDMAAMLRQWCGTRPTVLVLSACFSGSFVDALKAPHRMIMTAARRDRTSFGCGEGEVYPWFDACVLETLPTSQHFLDLASHTRACVNRREQDANIELASEPQVFIGAEMQMRLPLLRFAHGPP
jgi:hypothetical protein